MLEGKVIIVTGGSGLIGLEILKNLLSHGATVINLDMNKSGLEVVDIKCDLTSDEAIKNTIQEVIEKYRKIDGLVNNAYPRTKDWGNDFFNIKPSSWRKNVDYQLNSYFVITQKVLEHMVARGEGKIVMIASIYGVLGNDFTLYDGTDITPPAAYSAIKGGIINFTRYLASRFGSDGINVNCVSPGGIKDKQDVKFIKRYSEKVPLNRMGEPADIAPPVSFLLSTNANYITGQNLLVDGGWSIV